MLDYKDKVSLVKVDVNIAENREMSKEYSIRYIPASFFIDQEGNVSFSVVGTMKPEKIREELDKVVSD